MDDYALEDETVDIADVKGPLSEWIVKDRVRHGIKGRFLNFLTTQMDGKTKLYKCVTTPLFLTRVSATKNAVFFAPRRNCS